MIELSQVDLHAGQARLGIAGDTLNAAIYLARLLPARFTVSYITNLGQDAFSDRMLEVMAEERIDASLIGRHPSRLPGLYAIEVDAAGERTFRYWRDASAARTLFSGIGAGLEDLAGFDVILLSGITLAILSADRRAALITRLAALRDAGCQIVFDPNHRPRLWPDAATARDTFAAMWAATSLALPSYDDECRLHPGDTPADVLGRIGALGVPEIVLKTGAEGPIIRAGGRTLQPAFARVARVVDSSGAGDSFNAGYLAARLQGAAPEAAAQAGHALACRVIAHHGAVIPAEAMPT